MEGYAQVPLQKELFIAPFAEGFKTTTLGNSHWSLSAILRTKSLNIAFFARFLLLEG